MLQELWVCKQLTKAPNQISTAEQNVYTWSKTEIQVSVQNTNKQNVQETYISYSYTGKPNQTIHINLYFIECRDVPEI